MRNFILITFLLFSISCFAQEQVSNVYFDEHQSPLYVGSAIGFHSHEGVDYMIIDNDSLQIYELENETFELKHTIDLPKEFAYRIWGKVKHNSSQKSIDGNFYYLFFRSGIMVVDLSKGTVHRSLELSELDYRMYRVLKKTDDQIYFYGFFGESGRGFFRYDVEANEIHLLDEFQNTSFGMFILKHTRYYADEDNGQIMAYDILKDSFFVAYEYTGGLRLDLQFRHNMGEEYCVFRDQVGFKIIKKDGEIEAFTCHSNLPDNTTLAWRGDKYIVASKYDNEDKIRVYNANTCMLLQEVDVADDNYYNTNTFYINDNMIEDYTIVGYYGHYFGFGLGIVLDHTSNTESYSFTYDFVYSDAAVETDNALYWVGYDEIELSPSYYYVMRYDKETKQVASISPYEGRVFSSSIGVSKGDEIYFSANDLDNDYNIWKTSNGNEFDVIMPLDFRYNLGIYSIVDRRVEDDKVISSGIGGMMITEGETEVLSSGAFKRDMAVTEDYIATLIREDDTNYVLKYDRHTGTSKKIYLNKIDNYSFGPIITDKYIFDVHPPSSFYFDIKNETNKDLTDNSTVESIDASRFYVSKDYMLIREFVALNSPYKYYFFNFETEELVKYNGAVPRSFQTIVTDDNRYYLDNSDTNFPNEEVTRVRPGESPLTIYEGDCHEINMNYPVSNQSGKYAILLFECEEEVIIIADDGQTQISSTLPSADGLHIYHRMEDGYVLGTFNEGGITYYLFNGPDHFVEIDIPSTEEFVETSFDLPTPLIITLNREEKIYRYYLLNKTTGELTLEMETTYEGNNAPRILYPPYAVSGTQFLMTMYHENFGYELTEIDLEAKSLTIKADLYGGRSSSIPRYYTRTANFIYFIAELEDEGKQWFRVSADMLSSHEEIKIEVLQDIVLAPNPTEAILRTDKVMVEYEILNTQGQRVMKSRHNQDTMVDVSQLGAGQYVLVGRDVRGLWYRASFVKI